MRSCKNSDLAISDTRERDCFLGAVKFVAHEASYLTFCSRSNPKCRCSREDFGAECGQRMQILKMSRSTNCTSSQLEAADHPRSLLSRAINLVFRASLARHGEQIANEHTTNLRPLRASRPISRTRVHSMSGATGGTARLVCDRMRLVWHRLIPLRRKPDRWRIDNCHVSSAHRA